MEALIEQQGQLVQANVALAKGATQSLNVLQAVQQTNETLLTTAQKYVLSNHGLQESINNHVVRTLLPPMLGGGGGALTAHAHNAHNVTQQPLAAGVTTSTHPTAGFDPGPPNPGSQSAAPLANAQSLAAHTLPQQGANAHTHPPQQGQPLSQVLIAPAAPALGPPGHPVATQLQPGISPPSFGARFGS